MKTEFLDLGDQPIANAFLHPGQKNEEYYYKLRVGFDDTTKLVSLMDFVDPPLMFNEDYVYHSSMSKTMRDHFSSVANALRREFRPKNVLEIGSNDGVFIKNFSKEQATAVEPCSNFASLTNKLGFKTYDEFWTRDLAFKIVEHHGLQDLIFSANCMCHVQDLDEAFSAIASCISPAGIFVFEDPSLLKMIQRVSYDQIYDEHAHIFSITAIRNILAKHGMEIFRVEELSVHGGSNRIYSCLAGSRRIEDSVSGHLEVERKEGLGDLKTYKNFASRVEQSKNQLLDVLNEMKRLGKKVVSYGATSKSTTVFNYCGIDNGLIDYIVDTTPDKQGKLSPGAHIPVISPDEGFNDTIDYAFLGAWNYKQEICDKEKHFLKTGKFITHVPYVRFISGDDSV